MKILVTGANGFVGRTLCADLVQRGFNVVAAVRRLAFEPAAVNPPRMQIEAVGDIGAHTDWTAALNGCACVVHLAARAHIMRDSASSPLAAFRAVNVDGTVQLARAALEAGIKRFVFVSSVGIHGNQNARAFTESDAARPAEDYAVSKLEAEQALRRELAGSAMELVIVRPPLVYGPGCPGNFLRLLKLLSSGVPLPFGAIDAKRSFVSVWNLADFLATCAVHENAANNVFLVSDMEDVALPCLLEGLAGGMGHRAPIFPFPPGLLSMAATMLGKGVMYDKLCGSLTVDATHAQRTLNWCVPVSLAEGLHRTGKWYAQSRAARA